VGVRVLSQTQYSPQVIRTKRNKHNFSRLDLKEARTLEDWKIKITVLWIVLWCAGILTPFLELYMPGYVKELFSGLHEGTPTTPELQLVIAFIMIIPLVMAFLSLTLKDSINRWANIIVGIVWIGASLFDPIAYGTGQSAYSAYAAYVILIGIVEVMFTASIVWYAWKSKMKA
jgi:hypothetical protein